MLMVALVEIHISLVVL